MYDRKGAITVPCFICSKPFGVTPYKAQSDKPLCCSRACEGLRRRQKARELRFCKECNTSFEFYLCELRKNPNAGQFCSQKCAGALTRQIHTGKTVTKSTRQLQSKAKRGKKPSNYTPTEFTCKHCHNTTTLPAELLLKRRLSDGTIRERQFCSADCSNQYMREHPEMYPRWKDGRYRRYGSGWHGIANAIRERDNNTCQNCGLEQLKPKLDVHHKTPLRLFAGDLDLAHDPANLVTLCKPCHRKREPD